MATVSPARKILEFLLGGPSAVLKAGSVYTPSGPSMATGSKEVKVEAWQQSAWRYWRKLGEIRFPTEHLARQVGRLDWDVFVNGAQLPEDQALELLEEVTTGLGPTETSRMLALNLQVPGEAWYVEEKPGVFAVYSVTTPKLEEKITAARADGRMAWRCYFPDPVEPNRAESGVQTALGPAEELVTLEALSRAQSRSRIAQAGLLLVASQISFEDGSDPFGADLERAMMTGIADPNDPSAMVPIKAEVDMEFVENGVRHISFDRPYDERLDRRVTMAIRRIALALDIPADLLLGTENATHWTAWLTALETYTSHLEPLALPIGELYGAVAETLREREGRPAGIEFKPNGARILAKRSTVRDALDAAKIGAVGLRYVRTAIGADDDDAPTPEELEILLRIPADPGREPLVDEERGEPQASGPDPVSASLQTLNGAADPIRAAMGVALTNARSKVGAKLRAAVMSDPDLRERIDGVPNDDVVFVLGGDAAAERIDVNGAVLDGLAPFRAWWASHHPGITAAVQATTLFGVWVADTLDRPSSELAAIPDWLVSEVASGRPAIKEVAHATTV